MIALLDAADRFHARAVELDRQLAARPRVTSTAVLIECGDGFGARGTWRLVAPFLAGVSMDPRYTVVDAERALVGRAVAFRDRHPARRWGLTDCVSFVVMKDRGITEALATDKHFREAGSDALLLDA